MRPSLFREKAAPIKISIKRWDLFCLRLGFERDWHSTKIKQKLVSHSDSFGAKPKEDETERAATEKDFYFGGSPVRERPSTPRIWTSESFAARHLSRDRNGLAYCDPVFR